VIEYEPDSAQARVYRELASAVADNEQFTIPTPLGTDELESLALQYI
jgi:nitrogenase iron protein NifH